MASLHFPVDDGLTSGLPVQLAHPLLSVAYSRIANPICFKFCRQADCFAVSLAFVNAGSNIAARIAMMAMTTRSSIKVKARSIGVLECRSIEARVELITPLLQFSITPLSASAAKPASQPN